jgi:hypothetical protein
MTSFLDRKLGVDRKLGKAISGVQNLDREEADNEKSGNKIAWKDRKLGLAISGSRGISSCLKVSWSPDPLKKKKIKIIIIFKFLTIKMNMEQLTVQHYLLLGRQGEGEGGCGSRVLSVQQITIQYLLKGKGSEKLIPPPPPKKKDEKYACSW